MARARADPRSGIQRLVSYLGEPPRSWYERLYRIQRWTVFPRGGHFAAAEEPDLLAGDIAGFFAQLR